MPLHILIVEDEHIPRETMADEINKGKRFVTRKRSDPRTAITYIKKQPLDGAIVDLFFPKHSGYAGLSVVALIRQYNPDAYIEVVTGHVGRIEEAINKGADKVLKKPLSFADDLNRVGAGIANKRLIKLAAKFDISPGFIIPSQIIDNEWYMLINEFDIIFDNLIIIGRYMRSKEKLRSIACDIIHNTIRKFSYEANTEELRVSPELESNLNFNVLQDNYVQLKETHIGDFVGIANGEILGFAGSFRELWENLKDRYSPDQIFIHQIK
jgi:CheY-like chemotaxis protein